MAFRGPKVKWVSRETGVITGLPVPVERMASRGQKASRDPWVRLEVWA